MPPKRREPAAGQPRLSFGVQPSLSSAHDFRERIRRLAFGEDDAVATEHYVLPLVCPLSKRRLTVPARGRDCRHIDCFDRDTFLTAPASDAIRVARIPRRPCPITSCRHEIPEDEIVVDLWIQEVLNDFPADVDRVLLHADMVPSRVAPGPARDYCVVDTQVGSQLPDEYFSVAVKAEPASQRHAARFPAFEAFADAQQAQRPQPPAEVQSQADQHSGPAVVVESQMTWLEPDASTQAPPPETTQLWGRGSPLETQPGMPSLSIAEHFEDPQTRETLCWIDETDGDTIVGVSPHSWAGASEAVCYMFAALTAGGVFIPVSDRRFVATSALSRSEKHFVQAVVRDSVMYRGVLRAKGRLSDRLETARPANMPLRFQARFPPLPARNTGSFSQFS